MPCIFEEDYNLDEFCDVSAAGVDQIDVIQHKKGEASFSDSIEGTEGGLVNGVLTGADAATPANWKTIHQDIEIAEATQDVEGSRENGTVAYPVKVMLTMHYGSDPARNAKINRLATELETRNSMIVLTMQDGSKRLYGRNNGLRGTEGNDSTGKAMNDLNGVNIVLNGKEPRRWNPVRVNEGTPANIEAGYQAIVLP